MQTKTPRTAASAIRADIPLSPRCGTVWPVAPVPAPQERPVSIVSRITTTAQIASCSKARRPAMGMSNSNRNAV